jgi:hypothetical protein
MAINLSDLTALSSRVTRKKIGNRKLPSMDRIGQGDDRNGGGSSLGGLGGALGTVLGTIWGGFEGFLFLVGRGLFSGLAFTFTNAWSLLVQTGFFLANFDWNASDDEIDKALQGRWIGWAGTLGTGIGGTLGWFACGILPVAGLFSFNEAMAAYVLTEFGEEAQEEMAGYLAAIIRQSANVLAASAFAQTYKTTRTLIKAAPGIRALIPGIDRWGAKDGATFTIASTIENQVLEKIPNPLVRAFAENLYEEFFEACIEAGFVVAAGMDGWVASQAARNPDVSGEVIEIKPNRESDEVIHLAGSRTELKAQIPAVLAQHQIIRNREIGDVVAVPMATFIQTGAEREFSLQIQLNSNQKPPHFSGDRRNIQTASIVISDLSRAGMDWEKIRRAIGVNGYQYGPYVAVTKMTNGRQFHVYAGSSAIAEAKAKDFAALSDSNIKILNISQLTNEGERKLEPHLDKNRITVYPYKGKITRVIRRVGQKDELRSYSFPLWTDSKPQDWDENIQRLLSNTDGNP